MRAAPAEAVAEPHTILHEEGEDVLVGDGVDVADYHELLAVLHEEGYVFTEKREGRIRYHNVSVL